MEERKFIRLKKEEYGVKEYVKRNLGKGKISRLDIEYTPIGEKIVVSTHRPGLVIGRKGEKIDELTRFLKQRFKLENPHIEIKEIEEPLFDSQIVADEIALALERMGNLKFKVIAYRKLQEIIKAGALGCELRLSGKLPGDRANSWRFAEGYLKKSGEGSKEIDRAQSTALTKTGVIGIKVAIMGPKAKIFDQIIIDDAVRSGINEGSEKVSTPKKKEKLIKSEKEKKPVSSTKDDSEIKKKVVKKSANKKDNKEDGGNLEPRKEDEKTIVESHDSMGDAIKIEEDLENAGEEELELEEKDKAKKAK